MATTEILTFSLVQTYLFWSLHEFFVMFPLASNTFLSLDTMESARWMNYFLSIVHSERFLLVLCIRGVSHCPFSSPCSKHLHWDWGHVSYLATQFHLSSIALQLFFNYFCHVDWCTIMQEKFTLMNLIKDSKCSFSTSRYCFPLIVVFLGKRCSPSLSILPLKAPQTMTLLWCFRVIVVYLWSYRDTLTGRCTTFYTFLKADSSENVSFLHCSAVKWLFFPAKSIRFFLHGFCEY